MKKLHHSKELNDLLLFMVVMCAIATIIVTFILVAEAAPLF